MSTVKLIIEMESSDAAQEAASLEMSDASDMAKAPKAFAAAVETADIEEVQIDASFGMTPMKSLEHDPSSAAFGLAIEPDMERRARSGPEVFAFVPEVDTTYLVRADVEEKDAEKVAKKLEKRPGVKAVFADVPIEPQLICPGSPPLGNDGDVERLLCTAGLHRNGANGAGVLVAIVDTGVNMAYLNSKGKNPTFDAARSWVPRTGLTPGSLPVGHGTMCAFDVCIAAPQCTLLDIALLQSNASGPTSMSGLLSDGVRAYNHLIDIMRAPRRPGETRSLVVNNSWGMFHPRWDFPVGHSGNYSDNPNHPFNRIVGTLAGHGADILFAAGNCGSNCPDGRCQGVTSNVIYGANGHPQVTCVAGVDTSKTRVGYSSKGPGRLTRNKPDISGYTHFAGSGVYAADGGTSAATPVVSGVFAAIRTKRPYVAGNASRTPDAIRNFVTSTATDLGTSGYDFDHGHGVVNGCEISRQLGPVLIDICKIRPDFCRPIPLPIPFCKRFPQLCKPRIPIPLPKPPIPIPPIPGPGPRPPFGADDGSMGDQEYGMLDLSDSDALASLAPDELAELFYYIGQYHAMIGGGGSAAPQPAPSPGKGGCSCGG